MNKKNTDDYQRPNHFWYPRDLKIPDYDHDAGISFTPVASSRSGSVCHDTAPIHQGNLYRRNRGRKPSG